jgi:hypothetical protein
MIGYTAKVEKTFNEQCENTANKFMYTNIEGEDNF